jgi:8-oxo-dGTP pyrophosphatase MutT (NUDIX family)
VVEVVWVILRLDDRFLLTQRSLNDKAGGTWCFPVGKVDPHDTSVIIAAHRELKEKVGLGGNWFRRLCQIDMDQYHIHVFLCDKWHGIPKLAYEDAIGVGWFTCAEMYSLGKSLAPFVDKSLSYLLYLIQHYDHHPDEWRNQLEICDESG